MSNEGRKHRPDANTRRGDGFRVLRGSMVKALKFIYVSAATGEGS